MENPLNNRKNTAETKGDFEQEKLRLAENSEEVLSLLAEKDPNRFTERAKLILAHIGMATFAASTLAVAGGGVFSFMKPINGAPLSPEHKALAQAIFGIGVLLITLGLYNDNIGKLENLVQNAGSNIEKAKS